MTKLLILDDSELIRSRLLALLSGIVEPAEIAATGTLEQALHCVAWTPPSLAILDLHLPDGNSAQILPTLKQLAPQMKVAMLSNDASDSSRQRCLQAGADWFFDKSTEYEQVLHLIQCKMALH